MITYNKYFNSRDYTWYDSSNVVYSECIDKAESTKNLKVVFKQGRTYIYKDVDVNDYILFKNSESTGEGFNKYIKKYKAARLPDIDLAELDGKKDEFINETKVVDEALTNLSYKLEMNKDTQEFRLSLNGKAIYEGVEGNVSILRLLKSMSINYSFSELEEPIKANDEFEEN